MCAIETCRLQCSCLFTLTNGPYACLDCVKARLQGRNAWQAAPSSLTDEVIKRICDELRQGGTKAAAAAASGYSLSAFMQWQAAGRKEIDSIADGNPANRSKVQMVKFVEAMADAELVGEAELIRVIRRASEDHWQAAAWILERRHPEKYGRRMDVSSKGDTA